MNTQLGALLFVFFISSLVTYLLIPVLQKLAHDHGFVVTPRAKTIALHGAIRKASHHHPIALSGGLAIVLAFMISMLASLLVFPRLITGSMGFIHLTGLLLGGLIIGLLGLADDLWKVSYLIRLLVGSLVVLALLAFTVYGGALILPGGYLVKVGGFEMVILFIWCLGLINAINLIDGLDGSAAGIVAMAACWIALISVNGSLTITIMAIGIMACCFAFLAHNFYPANLFLGSTGTLFLGFLLAFMTIWQPARGAPNAVFPYAILILAVPVFDMAVVFFERLMHGKNPFVADSWHIHDRVLLTGVSRKQACWLIWALSFSCGLFAYISFRGMIPYFLAVLLVVAVLIVFYLIINRYKQS